tara:strand:+ start:166 stop:336 length:171 start_codon:yes stop_codon:yes gene_type:complete
MAEELFICFWVIALKESKELTSHHKYKLLLLLFKLLIKTPVKTSIYAHLQGVKSWF